MNIGISDFSSLKARLRVELSKILKSLRKINRELDSIKLKINYKIPFNKYEINQINNSA
jgi:hypothetical protein